VLIGVPIAAAAAALISVQRVRISPLGVSQRVTPPPPAAWRIAPLAVGVVLFLLGMATTNSRQIGGSALPSILIILVGLVLAGPWLTARAARLLRRFASGGSALLAARRLGDNPQLAFRSVSGLVLAVFLGTVLAGILPAVERTEASPQSAALQNVLLDGFTAAGLCGNNVNCTGGNSPATNPLAGPQAQRQRIALEGMPPQPAAALLTGLHAISGATVIPVWSPRSSGHQTQPQAEPQAQISGQPGPGPGGGIVVGEGPGEGVISCAGLRQLAVLGQCAPGRQAVLVSAGNLFNDNPMYSTQPIASAFSPAASADVSGLYLQALLVKVNSSATLEQVRTYLVTHVTDSASGSAPRTFGESVQARAAVATTVERLLYTAVVLTLLVAGCSLAVSVGGSLVERKRPFTLLRVTGTQVSALYRVVLLEAVLPLAAATVVAGGLAYLIAVVTVSAIAPAGTPVPTPASAYYLTMGCGLAGSLLIIAASLPLLRRLTSADGIRFE